jgi:hypothetical protein
VLLPLLACRPPDALSPSAVVDRGRHAIAGASPLYALASADAGRHPWCDTCHRPDGDGIGCGTCHGDDPRSCADCHQFDLPTALDGPPSGVAGQDTVAEWASSAYADTPCTSCHDPHDPRGGHDPDRVRAAIRATAVSVPGGVEYEIAAVGVGHALPTGDPFRRLVLEVCADLECRRVLGRAVFQRRIADDDPVHRWGVAEDTRIPPRRPGRPAVRSGVVPLDVPRRSWRLLYHLADPRHEAALGPDWGYVVANGLLEDR